jgi:hypothetical protein
MGAKTFFGQPCFLICLFFFFLGEVVAVTGLKKFQVYLFGVQNGQVQGQEILGNLKATRMDQRSEWKGDLPLRKGAIGHFHSLSLTLTAVFYRMFWKRQFVVMRQVDLILVQYPAYPRG